MATVQMRVGRVFTASGELEQRLKRLERAAGEAAMRAAREANKVSKDKAKAIRPPAPPRRGRVQAPGALSRAIQWEVINGDIVLDRKRLDNVVPWWVVQEIGTGKTASAKEGKDTEGGASSGRPKKDDYNNPGGRHFRVKSQRGRRIPGSLVFASAIGGPYSPPGASRTQQLFLRRDVLNAPPAPTRRGRTHSLVIKREIEGKHFIRDGAREGFRDYRNDLVAAAHAALGRKP